MVAAVVAGSQKQLSRTLPSAADGAGPDTGSAQAKYSCQQVNRKYRTLQARTWPPTGVFSAELAKIGDLHTIVPPIPDEDDLVNAARSVGGALIKSTEPVDSPFVEAAQPLEHTVVPSRSQQHPEPSRHSSAANLRVLPRKGPGLSELERIVRVFQLNLHELRKFKPDDGDAWKAYNRRWLGRMRYVAAQRDTMPEAPLPLRGETPAQFVARLLREHASEAGPSQRKKRKQSHS